MHEYKLIQMGLKSNRWDSCFSGAWLSQQRATFSGVKASSIHIAERNSQLYKEDRHAMHFQRFYSFQHYYILWSWKHLHRPKALAWMRRDYQFHFLTTSGVILYLNSNLLISRSPKVTSTGLLSVLVSDCWRDTSQSTTDFIINIPVLVLIVVEKRKPQQKWIFFSQLIK